MKVALISDIHANLPALEAVLADIDRRADVEAVYHLGDIVGYAPWPNEVVALLRERGIAGIAGNYDSTTATDYKHCGCRYENPRQEELSHQSYAWTLARVSPDSKRFLAALPFRMDVWPLGGHLSGTPRLTLVHGSPTLNTLYWTEDRPDSFCLQMAEIAGMKPGDAIARGERGRDGRLARRARGRRQHQRARHRPSRGRIGKMRVPMKVMSAAAAMPPGPSSSSGKPGA